MPPSITEKIARKLYALIHGDSSRHVHAFLLIAAYFIVSAAAYHGFYSKWGFRDDDPKFSMAVMLDGTADRPYVYRQFLPILANTAEAALPENIRKYFSHALFTTDGSLKSGLKSPDALNPRYALRYHFMYYATFVFLLASLFVMRELCLACHCDPFSAAVAPAVLALCIPFLQSRGGYFYDFTELFFFMTAILLALKGRYFSLMPIAILATANKESFFFFSVTLYPFIRERLNSQSALALVGTLLALTCITYLTLRIPYAGNNGATTHNHAIEGLVFYSNPMSLFGREITYGLKTFTGYSLVTLIIITAVIIRGWHDQSTAMRRHMQIAAAVNLPLFLAFCFPGEMRNLSMLYGGFLLLLASSLSRLREQPHPDDRRPPP